MREEEGPAEETDLDMWTLCRTLSCVIGSKLIASTPGVQFKSVALIMVVPLQPLKSSISLRFSQGNVISIDTYITLLVDETDHVGIDEANEHEEAAHH